MTKHDEELVEQAYRTSYASSLNRLKEECETEEGKRAIQSIINDMKAYGELEY